MNKYNLKIFIISILLFFLITPIFNFLVNPYDSFNNVKINKFNYFKPYESYNRTLAQFNRLQFVEANDYILGSSTANTLFDPSDTNLMNGKNNFYNLGIPGQNFFSTYRTLKHLINIKKIDTIILNLDFFNFWLIKELKKGYSDHRFSINLKNDQRYLYFFKDMYSVLFSKDTTFHSIKTILKNCCIQSEVSNDNINLYQADGSRNNNWYLKRINNSKEKYLNRFMSSVKSYAFKDLEYKSDDIFSEKEQGALKYLLSLLYLCKKNNINLITVINPLHDTIFYTLSETKAIDKYISWINDIFLIYKTFNQINNKNYFIWDFSLHKNNSQKISDKGDIFFFDGHHASKKYGKAIIENINNYYMYNDKSFILNFKNIEDYKNKLRYKFSNIDIMPLETKNKIDKIIKDQNDRYRWTARKSLRIIEMNNKLGLNANTNLIWDTGDNKAKCQKEFLTFFKTLDLFWISPINNRSKIPESVLKKLCGTYY